MKFSVSRDRTIGIEYDPLPKPKEVLRSLGELINPGEQINGVKRARSNDCLFIYRIDRFELRKHSKKLLSLVVEDDFTEIIGEASGISVIRPQVRNEEARPIHTSYLLLADEVVHCTSVDLTGIEGWQLRQGSKSAAVNRSNPPRIPLSDRESALLNGLCRDVTLSRIAMDITESSNPAPFNGDQHWMPFVKELQP